MKIEKLELKVQSPLKERTHTFYYLVEPLFKKIFLNSNQIRKLETLCNTLLPKLVRDKIKIT